MSVPPRPVLVAAARDSIAKGSKSFAMASRLFDRETRERAWLLYAWCRACDDLADGQEHGHALSVVADPAARLAEIHERTEAALAGQPSGLAAFDGLGVVVAECGIPHHLPRDLIAGFALDADGFSPRDEGELLQYCYHVAGAVGCMMAVVMGVDPRDEAVLDRACDLGLAFQLANIARDLDEDDAGGRCYLPADWLAEMDVPPGETMRPPYRASIAVLARRLADRAAAYEESARHGTPALSFRSAWAVLAAAGIYGDIARTVAARGRRAWDSRVVTSKGEKLGWVAKAAGQAARRKRSWHGDAPRTGLWTRPRGRPEADPFIPRG
ncbi:phytoene/squalene synthase family protein [Sphingomonas solaris]|uniref:Phytoene/squalene synthase family protein n=1 Tax=Alterirhizorhabdus solaris TaxID=2529389 RepID=A0A558QSH5_9SPHN|nr:phytoene/squalene synthase family protein [Sphingomonas solaris]TVV70090.1 phytoene/squalene synthase family protein [Sphingomonas solaris]